MGQFGLFLILIAGIGGIALCFVHRQMLVVHVSVQHAWFSETPGLYIHTGLCKGLFVVRPSTHASTEPVPFEVVVYGAPAASRGAAA